MLETVSKTAGKPLYFLSKLDAEVLLPTQPFMLLKNLHLSPLDKKKYKWKIQDKALSAPMWTWQLHRMTTSNKVWQYREIMLRCFGLVVMVFWPKNHAWTHSHHLRKVLLEVMVLYKQQLLHKHICM